METKKERVYNPDIVVNHPVDVNLKMPFARILSKDYGDDTYGFSEDVLNMLCIDHDAWEQSISNSHSDTDHTMDCSTGVAAFDDNRRKYSNHRHLLIELKLKCKAHTLRKEDYIDKISHSRVLLSGHRVHPANIFIFVESVQPKAKSDISKWSRGSDGSSFKSIVPLTPKRFNNIDGFNDFIGFEHQFPYTPVNSAGTIVDGLIGSRGNSQELIDKLSYWKTQVTRYIGAYNLLEAAHICSTIDSIRDDLLESFADGFEKDYMAVELNDFKKNFA